MTSDAKTPEEYISGITEERKPYMHKLQETILHNLPAGFREEMSYGMIGYVIPQELYTPGFHVNPGLHDWWVAAYQSKVKSRLDMCTSSVRFKKLDDIPLDLIGELCTKMSMEEWITIYENQIKNHKNK